MLHNSIHSACCCLRDSRAILILASVASCILSACSCLLHVVFCLHVVALEALMPGGFIG